MRAKVKEMNKWVLSNGDDVNYSIVEDANAGAHGIIIHVRGTLTGIFLFVVVAHCFVLTVVVSFFFYTGQSEWCVDTAFDYCCF